MIRWLVLAAGAVILATSTPVSAAVILAWDAVTTDINGQPLDPGLEVLEYHVYQCVSGLGSCTLNTAIRIGVVPVPATQLDITGKTIPSAYFVTAANKVGESAESNVVKVVPPSVPRNHRLLQ